MKGTSQHSSSHFQAAQTVVDVDSTMAAQVESKTKRGISSTKKNFSRDVQTSTFSMDGSNNRQCRDLDDSTGTADGGGDELSFTGPSKLTSRVATLTKELIHREAVIGRYDPLTGQSYEAVGDYYMQIGEPGNAVMMHRAAHRINTILYGGHCTGNIRGKFLAALLRQSVPESKLALIEYDMEQSVRCEMLGDMLRQFGLKGPAVIEYQKAARVEEFAFGRENPDLAFLWRKIACLAAIRISEISEMDMEQMDRVGSKWFRQLLKENESNPTLHPKICSVVKRGDDFYKSLLYNKAVGQYRKAVTMDVNNSSSNRRSPSRSKTTVDQIPGGSESRNRVRSTTTQTQNHHPRTHHRRHTPTGDVLTELKVFLQTKTRDNHNENNNHRKSSASRAALLDKAQGGEESKSRPPITPAHNRSEEVPFQPDGASNNALSIEPIFDSHKSGSTGSVGMSHQMNVPDSQEIEPIVSRSKMLKPQHSSSGAAMYQAFKQYVDPKADPSKPKSDSYLTKLANKTSRIAKKTRKKIKKTIAAGSTHTCNDEASTSQASLQYVRAESRPKSESYNMIDSPPMTPITPAICSFADAKLMLRRMDLESFSDIPASTPPRSIPTSAQSSDSTPTTANTASRAPLRYSGHEQLTKRTTGE